MSFFLIKLFFSIYALVEIGNSYHNIVNVLERYVESNKTFALELNETFIEAGFGPNSTSPTTYDAMYTFFDEWIPIAPNYTDWSFNHVIKSYINTNTGKQIINSVKGQEWMQMYLIERKTFCDSANSSYIVSSYENWDMVNMSEYITPPNGFQSFNAFFTRTFKDGMRPISAPNNDSIITSPCDCIVLQVNLNNMTKDKVFDIKGEELNISQSLNNPLYSQIFERNGSAILLFLNTYNYHRYHSAVSGHVAEYTQLSGYNFWAPQPNEDTLYARTQNMIFFTNNNRRGILYVYNDLVGLVGNVYVGIDVDGSVNINTDAGIHINKGDGTGYFKFGGSSILLLFEPGAVQQFTVEVNQSINLGQTIAIANNA